MGAAPFSSGGTWNGTNSMNGMGIGMANISERLRVLYGDTARMTIDSQRGKGTLVRIRLPLLQAESAVPEGFYEERSSTRR
jgi:LytS/YehU family sensor histidine kinase